MRVWLSEILRSLVFEHLRLSWPHLIMGHTLSLLMVTRYTRSILSIWALSVALL